MIGTHEPLWARVVAGLIVFAPYIIVSWAYTTFIVTEGGVFWATLGTLLGLRAFFGLVEMLGSSLQWHLFAKKSFTRQIIQLFRQSAFPKRYCEHDNLLAYLSRISTDTRCSDATKDIARQMHFALGLAHRLGVRRVVRMQSAMELVLDLYSIERQDEPANALARTD